MDDASYRARPEACEANAEAVAAAKAADLVYVSDEEPGIRRKRTKIGFSYVHPDGKPLRDPEELKRLRSLAIPPAYEDVWICPHPHGHIQATGRDARSRKQYRYHPRWREIRDANKYEDMIAFGRLLPKLRARIAADMAKRGLPREKVLATIVELLQTTLIRVGNEDYARSNKSYGLTTLRNRHVAVDGGTLRFEFKGKSGKTWKLKLHDRRIARVVKACHDLPGQDLFQYIGSDGERHGVSSADVNAYLKEISGRDVTAKHFRTWAGTVLAAIALAEFEAVDSATAAKRNIKAAIERVAARLGNTPTICRKCYVHPEVLTAYLEGNQLAGLKQKVEAELGAAADLRREEAALLGLLNRRLTKDLHKAKKAA
jgi:DNA topoisomerase I